MRPCLTDARELGQWFGQRASLNLRIGGEGWLEWDGHGRFPETGFKRAASANENEGGWTEMLGELRKSLGEG